MGGLQYGAAMLPHYLQPLLAPNSVALVGATEREGALGAIVWRNLAAAGLRGELYPLNPKHRTVFGKRSRRTVPWSSRPRTRSSA
jgi:acetyltransferase